MERRALLGLAVVATAAASTSARASSGGAAASADTYIRLPVVTASILQANGRRGVLTIETGVDVPDAALRTRARARRVPARRPRAAHARRALAAPTP